MNDILQIPLKERLDWGYGHRTATKVLASLARFPEYDKPSEISAITEVESGNLYRVVKRLIEDKLVRRNVKNSRYWSRYELTSLGVDLVEVLEVVGPRKSFL